MNDKEMVAVKERLFCQHCGSKLLDHEEDILNCISCAREHDLKGILIKHPVGTMYDDSLHQGPHKKRRSNAYL